MKRAGFIPPDLSSRPTMTTKRGFADIGSASHADFQVGLSAIDDVGPRRFPCGARADFLRV